MALTAHDAVAPARMTHDPWPMTGSERLPPIHRDRLSRHPRGLVAHQEGGDVGYFLGLAVAAAGDARQDALVEGGILLLVALPQPALEEDRARRDAVDADALRG